MSSRDMGIQKRKSYQSARSGFGGSRFAGSPVRLACDSSSEPSRRALSILHVRQEQPLRRRRPPRLGTVTRLEDREQSPRIPPARADFDQGPDDVPDHVAEEAVAGYPHDERQVESRTVFD